MLKGWLVIKNISNYVSIAENCCVDWRSNKSGTSALLSVGILLIFSPTFSKICFIYFIETCKVILSDNWPRGQASQSHTFEKSCLTASQLAALLKDTCKKPYQFKGDFSMLAMWAQLQRKSQKLVCPIEGRDRKRTQTLQMNTETLCCKKINYILKKECVSPSLIHGDCIKVWGCFDVSKSEKQVCVLIKKRTWNSHSDNTF